MATIRPCHLSEPMETTYAYQPGTVNGLAKTILLNFNLFTLIRAFSKYSLSRLRSDVAISARPRNKFGLPNPSSAEESLSILAFRQLVLAFKLTNR